MKCTDYDSDLLLYGLGELPFWRSWIVSLHLQRCHACRSRQRQLSGAANGLAEVLRSGRGGPRLQKRAVSVFRGWMVILTAVLLLTAGIATIGFVWSSGRRQHTAAKANPCRPDLPSDACR